MQKLLARRSSSTGVILFQAILFMHATSWAAEGIIYKAPAAGGTYCHLKFPAISEDTLFSDRPVLKSPSEGDIRDFYGPCDYDPLSKEEVLRQRRELERERRRRYEIEQDRTFTGQNWRRTGFNLPHKVLAQDNRVLR